MATITRNEYGYTIIGIDYKATIPHRDMAELVHAYTRDHLKESIIYELKQADGDSIDLALYPESLDDLAEEVYSNLENAFEYGDPPTDDDIRNAIDDIASYYNMGID